MECRLHYVDNATKNVRETARTVSSVLLDHN